MTEHAIWAAPQQTEDQDTASITPLHTSPDLLQHPVDHLPVIPPPITTPVAHRQKRLKPQPLSVSQITLIR
ncbi:hypothetical protein KSNIM_37520 [Kitasatospora sp. DSM 101779]|nr:hypothetical protein [Kitasatospora sp. DSM 101779]